MKNIFEQETLLMYDIVENDKAKNYSPIHTTDIFWSIKELTKGKEKYLHYSFRKIYEFTDKYTGRNKVYIEIEKEETINKYNDFRDIKYRCMLCDNEDNIRKEIFDINEIKEILDEYALEKFRLTEKIDVYMECHKKEIKVIGSGFRIGQ